MMLHAQNSIKPNTQEIIVKVNGQRLIVCHELFQPALTLHQRIQHLRKVSRISRQEQCAKQEGNHAWLNAQQCNGAVCHGARPLILLQRKRNQKRSHERPIRRQVSKTQMRDHFLRIFNQLAMLKPILEKQMKDWRVAMQRPLNPLNTDLLKHNSGGPSIARVQIFQAPMKVLPSKQARAFFGKLARNSRVLIEWLQIKAHADLSFLVTANAGMRSTTHCQQQALPLLTKRVIAIRRKSSSVTARPYLRTSGINSGIRNANTARICAQYACTTAGVKSSRFGVEATFAAAQREDQ